MIESPAFSGLPPHLRRLVNLELNRALDPASQAQDYAYLPAAEKATIRDILQEARLLSAQN
jgi:hypothetical protein